MGAAALTLLALSGRFTLIEPAKVNTLLESRGERRLKALMGAALWLATTIAVIGASFIPEVAPDNVNFWRLALGIPALLFGLSILIADRKLTTDKFQLWIELNMIATLGVIFVLLQLTPATIAVLFQMVATLIFAGYFLRLPALLLTLGGAVMISASTPFTEPAMQTPHLVSFLIVYVPTVVVTALLLHLQNNETLSALDSARFRSLTDPLTGLANLRAMERHAKTVLDPANVPAEGVVGLLLIDLDNFKSANTRHGHVGGDYALRMIARQMQRVAPPDATVARVGGDEFAVMLTSESRARVQESGEMFRAAVRAAASVLDMPGVEIDAAVGAAIFPDDGRDLSELLDVADKSMYSAKGAKRHAVPNLEIVPLPTDETPPWLESAARLEAPILREQSNLDSMTGGNNPTLAKRSLYARTSALAWAFGSVLLGISLLVPDAYADPVTPWWVLLFGGLTLSGFIYLFNASPLTPIHRLFDMIALAGIAGLIWATGGYASSVPPILVLLVASQAWFWGTRNLPLRLIGPALVVLSPLLYEPFALSGPVVIDVVAMYALLAMTVALVLAMYFNRYQLTRLRVHAERLANIDPLTGISNRRAFDAYVHDLLAQPDGGGKFAIVMIDLDNFKQVNTVRGHRGGDAVLQAIAVELHSVAREDDCIARIGGDEFAAVLPGVGVDGARSLAERFVSAVANAPAARDAGVGASAGFALHPLHGETLDELAFTADNALMAVKATGKGSARVARVVTAV